MTFEESRPWQGTSSDPHDRQFGDCIERTTVDDVGRFPATLVGEPYDGAVIGRPGARAGPARIRSALAGLHAMHLDLGEIDAVGDLGDIDLPTGYSVDTVQARLAEVTASIHDRDTIPVFLGGDNSVTVPNVAPLLERGSTGVLSFDTHFDCRVVEDQPSSGTPYRQLLERGLDELVVFGAKDFATSAEYVRFATERGVTVITVRDIMDDFAGALSTAEAALAEVDNLFVSLDLDVVTASAVDGVSAPTPGGLHPREVFDAVERVAVDQRIDGFEVVECAPDLGSDDQSAAVAARAVAHAIAGVSANA